MPWPDSKAKRESVLLDRYRCKGSAGIVIDTSAQLFWLTGSLLAGKTISNPEGRSLGCHSQPAVVARRSRPEIREPALLHLNFRRAGCHPICSFWKNGSPNVWTPEPYSSSKIKANLGMRKTRTSR